MSSLLLYLLIINALTAGVMAYDKLCAIKRRRRVPEKTLLSFALAGGSLAMVIVIQYIRHKSRKSSFLWRLYAIMALQAVLLAALGLDIIPLNMPN